MVLAKYLLLLCVIVGLSERGLSHISHSHDHSHCHPVPENCGDHHHPHEPCAANERDDSGDSGNSPDHHHHHSCCMPLPISAYDGTVARLMVPAASLAEMACADVLPPDDPVFALDKPPLI